MPDEFRIGEVARLRLLTLTDRTVGAITAGSTLLTVTDASAYANGNPICVEGAGPAGADLFTTVQSVDGTVITLAAAAQTTVRGAEPRRPNVGKPANPTNPRIRIKKPNGDVVTPAIVNDAQGRHHSDYTVDQEGPYAVAADGAGAAAGWGESSFVGVKTRW